MNDINGFFFSFSGKTFWMMLALTKREGRSYAVTMRLLARPPPLPPPSCPSSVALSLSVLRTLRRAPQPFQRTAAFYFLALEPSAFVPVSPTLYPFPAALLPRHRILTSPPPPFHRRGRTETSCCGIVACCSAKAGASLMLDSHVDPLPACTTRHGCDLTI